MALNNMFYVKLVLEFSCATFDVSGVLSYNICYVTVHDPWLILTLKGATPMDMVNREGLQLAGIRTASLNCRTDEWPPRLAEDIIYASNLHLVMSCKE